VLLVAIDIEVIQFPDVLVEVAPRRWRGGMHRVGSQPFDQIGRVPSIAWNCDCFGVGALASSRIDRKLTPSI
jgi:hypothetical protein